MLESLGTRTWGGYGVDSVPFEMIDLGCLDYPDVKVYADYACYYLHQMWHHPLEVDNETLPYLAAAAWNSSDCDLAEVCIFASAVLWLDEAATEPKVGEEIVTDCRELEELSEMVSCCFEFR